MDKDFEAFIYYHTDGETFYHEFGEWITTKEPSITEEGVRERSCACGAKESERIEKIIIEYTGLAYSVNSDGITCTITDIGDCTDTEVNIPEYIDEYKVTAIGSGAFRDCIRLTNIVIPNGVISIGVDAFYNCSSLTTIYYTGTPDEWDKISIGSGNDPLISSARHYSE